MGSIRLEIRCKAQKVKPGMISRRMMFGSQKRDQLNIIGKNGKETGKGNF